MKDTLIEIKNNLQGNNSRVDEAKNQINDLEHEEAKNNQSEQVEKIIQNHEDSISILWDKFKTSNICIIGVPEREKEEQKIENLFEKNNEGELPQSGKANRFLRSTASSENPKEVELKEKHTKTKHNYIAQD